MLYFKTVMLSYILSLLAFKYVHLFWENKLKTFLQLTKQDFLF